MTTNVLVTYSTFTGFTAGVAKAIANTLIENGIQTELLPMKEVKDFSSYDAVVAGSAIQSQQWLPEAMEFVSQHKDVLSTKPCAVFSVCMTLAMPKGEKYRQGVTGWIAPVRKLLNPVSEGLFPGGLNINKIPNKGDRFKFRMSVLTGVWKEGDHRDWKAINNWAAELAPLLKIENMNNK